MTYTIEVSNIGNVFGTGIVVTDTYPLELLTNVSATGGGVVDPANGTITWQVDRLDPNEVVRFNVTGTIPDVIPAGSNTLTNEVAVTDDGLSGPDLGSGNNTASDDTELQVFVYDGVRNDAESDPEDALRNYLDEREYALPPLPVAPIYSGAAQPGTTLNIVLVDENGAMLGTQTVVVDTGGNWLATFPNVILSDHPHAMNVSQQSTANDFDGLSGFNLRTYFSPATTQQIFFSHDLSVAQVFAGTPSATAAAVHTGLNNPLQMASGEGYAYEFLASSSTPTQYAR